MFRLIQEPANTWEERRNIYNMIETKRLARINELARIAKERPLTPEETEERAVLRKEYLEAFRANFKKQLDNIEIVD